MHVFHEPQLLNLPQGAAAIWGANYVQSALRAGFTTIRDLGAKSPEVFGLKRALNEGWTVGPRYLASGKAICITGGHGWRNLSQEADGPDEVRKLAREEIKRGADVIKLMATGGAGTLTELPTQVQLGVAEMRAAAEVAHDAGRPVAVHALATQGIINAIEAGADSVEHGVFLDERGAELLVKHDVALCPTLSVYPRIVERGPAGGEEQFVIDRSVLLRRPHLDSISLAVKAGVRIVFGTDATTLYNPVGDVSAELDLMRQAGMSALDIILSATRTAASVCRVEGEVGTLESGKIADITVTEGDATTNILDLTRTARVYRAGSLVYAKDDGVRSAGLVAAPILKADLAR
ncbi:amidohydrolase family protein [Terrarubrum flagellatum]|uniref:metal-dependent hydrolase family protein n=1 Tax=Terrirubrum flagellatum TaxID=2895980 RepID=UPI00314568F6